MLNIDYINIIDIDRSKVINLGTILNKCFLKI